MTEAFPHSFHTTRWSLVARLQAESDGSGVREALGELCGRCWFPIYAFVRRSGAGAQDAEDMTQGFFQHVLTHDLMAQAQREKGRFRAFLLGCLKHYMANEWQKGQAMRRGGHLKAVALDGLEAEERYRVEAAALSTADDDCDRTFDQQWAQGVLERAVGLLREEQKDAAKFELLLPTLTGTEDREAIMRATGMTDGALKVMIHRLRRRYCEVLRQVVAETVESEAEVDSELDYLAACLRK